MKPLGTLLARLARNKSGVAMIEFAYSAPVLALLLIGGVELSNFAITHMRVSQVAVSLADNASRAKQSVVSGVPRIREADVNEVFSAAQLQGGTLDFQAHGRLILSSLETNASGGQWIHWQRCFGDGDYDSSYGVQGDGATGTSLTGIGPTNRRVSAESGTAIMFVEVVYDYQPLLFSDFMQSAQIRKTAAMYVRDNRDLSGIYNPSPSVTANVCT
ncbi:MAG: pilus assembly protein [Sphingomonadales bacterium]|nr:pilus assembly protein [Sphingomonadales bacterium]